MILVMSISKSKILLTDDTRTQNKLTSEALDRVALATIQATADNTNFMVDKVVYTPLHMKVMGSSCYDELCMKSFSLVNSQDYELVSSVRRYLLKVHGHGQAIHVQKRGDI